MNWDLKIPKPYNEFIHDKKEKVFDKKKNSK